MAESNAISAQGTLLKRNGTAIAELRDMTDPPLSRKVIETTNHNSDDATFVVGIRRKGELQAEIGFLNTDPTHDATTGLLEAWESGSKDAYDIEYPDGGNWHFSGFVTLIGAKSPVDDGQVASISIQPSGGHIFT